MGVEVLVQSATLVVSVVHLVILGYLQMEVDLIVLHAEVGILGHSGAAMIVG